MSKIITFPDRTLRKPSSDVPRDFDLKALHKRLRDALLDANTNGWSGVGLSAVQIGEHLRAFIVKADDSDSTKLYVNPVFTSHSKKQGISREGCLSFPKQEADVKRYLSVAIKFYDEDWVERIETYRGWYSVVFQHEVDHLNGIILDQVAVGDMIDIPEEIINKRTMNEDTDNDIRGVSETTKDPGSDGPNTEPTV